MSAAISAAEKVDGFTRRSVRKALKQKRSQGSSQFRTQSSPVELAPLPQLKGNPSGGGSGRRQPRLVLCLPWGCRCRWETTPRALPPPLPLLFQLPPAVDSQPKSFLVRKLLPSSLIPCSYSRPLSLGLGLYKL